jgi:nitroimidazol reductase NimA-like FMN-containing flavoprotein (pyridoxamine 5'-phosphate oxidase superfamily)
MQPASIRTTVRRMPARAAYDRATIHAILDEALYCHVAFVHEGQPFAIPTAYARVGDALYVHGAVASRMLKTLAEGIPVCVTVTLLDGLVLARSAFHHSMNYRSVVIVGRATLVESDDERRAALNALVEHVARGRSSEVRAPNEKELRATMVLRVPLNEASAKARSGPPLDDAEDMTLQCWAGVVPLAITAGEPLVDGSTVAPPERIARYRRGRV